MKLGKFQSCKKYCAKMSQSEAVAQRCSVNKVFLKIFQNLQENTCAGYSGTGFFL